MDSRRRMRKYRYLKSLQKSPSPESSTDSQSNHGLEIVHSKLNVQDKNENENHLENHSSELNQSPRPDIPLAEGDYPNESSFSGKSNSSSISEHISNESSESANNQLFEFEVVDQNELEIGPLKEKLRNWAHKHFRCLTQVAINDLLRVLRSEGYVELPKTSKTLFNTSRATSVIRPMLNSHQTFGDYKYFGIRDNLEMQIRPDIYVDPQIKLLIHIDGADIFNRSAKHAWTILGLVHNSDYNAKPFLIAIYYGKGKPDSVQEFLSDLILELNDLITNGLKINNVNYSIDISAFICDTPARAYIKQVKGHTGFYACERCEVKGVTINNKRVYSNIDAVERTNDSFRGKRQPEHHSAKETSPLIDILQFDIIKSVVLDPMHLLYCGVSKTILDKIILHGPRCNYRIGQQQKNDLQILFNNVSRDIPLEFQRKKFDLTEINNWKATQFRFFLLYFSGLVLNIILPHNAYRHFMLLFVAVRILSNEDLALNNLDKARLLLRKFVQLMPTHCGHASQILNFHLLIHLPDDVLHMKQSLEHFSAFIFENTLGFIKRLFKSTTKPIAQLDKRINELKNTSSESAKKRYPLIGPVQKRSKVAVVKCIESTANKKKFDQIKLNNMTLKKTRPDNVFLLHDNSIIKIKDMFIRMIDGEAVGDIVIKAKKLEIIGDVFDYPLSSQLIGIYNVDISSQRVHNYSIKNIKKKCLLTEIDDKNIVVE